MSTHTTPKAANTTDSNTFTNHTGAKREIPADLQPGRTVTGIYLHTDRPQGMIVLRLLKGAQARMSVYEIADDVFERLLPGIPLSGVVDRVEFDGMGNMIAILKGEEFRQIC
jgi:hypothetical protein